MARKARVEFAGALYYVLDRGDRREEIFRGDEDRELFLKTLGEACGRTGWRLHAWVLMSNHYHLLLETPQPNLVAHMRWFQTTYTVRFNRRHRLSGHLFQGRCKAVVVDPQEPGYFTTLSDYIHLNPVRVKLAEKGSVCESRSARVMRLAAAAAFGALRGGGNAHRTRMDPNYSPLDADAYAAWINRRLGAEVRRRREVLGLSAYALGKAAGQVSDQTILNIEQDRVDPLLSTLARICVRFGITLSELVVGAERES